MKTLSIKDLHFKTGKWVRQAGSETITITDQGKPIAELRPLQAAPKVAFPHRRITDLPQSRGDSTRSISEERERA